MAAFDHEKDLKAMTEEMLLAQDCLVTLDYHNQPGQIDTQEWRRKGSPENPGFYLYSFSTSPHSWHTRPDAPEAEAEPHLENLERLRYYCRMARDTNEALEETGNAPDWSGGKAFAYGDIVRILDSYLQDGG